MPILRLLPLVFLAAGATIAQTTAPATNPAVPASAPATSQAATVASAPANPNIPEDLASLLNDSFDLLGAGKSADFLERAFSPRWLDNYKASGNYDRFLGLISGDLGARWLRMFKACQSQIPQMATDSEGHPTATFPGDREGGFMFILIDGKWRIR